MSLTPPLCEMLADPLLQDRYAAHLDRLRELAEKECERLKHDGRLGPLAAMYRNRFEACRLKFDALGRNLLTGFRHYRERGNLEILTCGATHGFLPNLRHSPRAVEAQLLVAGRNHERHFGVWPQGIWLTCRAVPSTAATEEHGNECCHRLPLHSAS
jgi:1,4-alpha-glucan branching enzyme